MIPLEGEAFFTSQIKEIPSASSACRKGKPVFFSMASASLWSSVRGLRLFFSSTRFRAEAASRSSIMFLLLLSKQSRVAERDQCLQLSQGFSAVNGFFRFPYRLLHGDSPGNV